MMSTILHDCYWATNSSFKKWAWTHPVLYIELQKLWLPTNSPLKEDVFVLLSQLLEDSK